MLVNTGTDYVDLVVRGLFQYKDCFTGIEIPIIKIRWSHLYYGIPIPVKQHLHIDTALKCQIIVWINVDLILHIIANNAHCGTTCGSYFKIEMSCYELMSILGHSMLERWHLRIETSLWFQVNLKENELKLYYFLAVIVQVPVMVQQGKPVCDSL